MSHVERMLAIPDPSDLARALVRHLSLPMGPSGPTGPTPPEHDVIDHLRSGAASPEILGRLVQAVAEILDEAECEIGRGERSPSLVRLVARLGYTCVSLHLAFDADQFFRIGHGLAQTAAVGRRIDERDLFQILRTIGRSPGRARTDAQVESFWASFLDHPTRGIRTLAAQNLVRSRGGTRAGFHMSDILDSDVNEGVVAREWLKVAGSVAALLAQGAFLDDGVLRRVAAALLSAGLPDPARAIDAHVGPAPAEVADGPRPVRPSRAFTFGGRTTKVGAPYKGLLVGAVAGLTPPASDEVSIMARKISTMFRNVPDPPDLDRVRTLQSEGEMHRLQLSVG